MNSDRMKTFQWINPSRVAKDDVNVRRGASPGRSVCASSACCGVFYVADRVRLLMWVLRPVFEKQRAASCRTRAAVNGAAELQETKSTNAKLLDGPPSWSVWSTMDVLVSLEHVGRPGQSGARWTSWSVWSTLDVLVSLENDGRPDANIN
ncbi:Hypothetical protein SMAX5B_003017 [Scophthalmus maximus]|uniref:Uncharacterized protein n=1 Tax=Scophthalmus maximus TaxID=52904 RepID=A0A2U9CGN7_SCOMX|nr:Hypothetical protein SMAX5B_003017 [Scophthalmus maximus]